MTTLTSKPECDVRLFYKEKIEVGDIKPKRKGSGFRWITQGSQRNELLLMNLGESIILYRKAKG